MKTQTGISVLHVATALSWRGGEQQVAYLVTGLAARNVRQYVLCTSGSAMETWCLENRIPFFTARKRSSLDITYAIKIRNICETNAIMLVHTHDSHAHTFAVMAALLGNRAGIIVSRRVDFEVGSGPFSRFKYNHSNVRRILCVSDKIRTVIAPVVKDPLKLVTIHSGTDFSRFEGKRNQHILHREYNLDEHVKIVANLSALAPHKDYATFIRVVALLRDRLPHTRYFIIGEGGERPRIEKLIRETGLERDITLTGFRNDIADIMPEVDLMLITSETEGLGTTILDAFACNVPVVATAAGGIPELVIHRQTGMLASVGDAAGLAREVEQVMNDENLRSQLVAGARHHLKNFSREATASKTLTEYLAVTGVSL